MQTANAICKLQTEFGRAKFKKPNEIKDSSFGMAAAYIVSNKTKKKEKSNESN